MSGESPKLYVWVCDACGDAACEMTTEYNDEDMIPRSCPLRFRAKWVIA